MWRRPTIHWLGSILRSLRFWYYRISAKFFGYDFFISYSHDAADYARRLEATLSPKYHCFRDQSSDAGILVGEHLTSTITKALSKSRVLVVLWSDGVAKNSWTRAECRYFATTHPSRPIILIFPRLYPGSKAWDALFRSPIDPNLEARFLEFLTTTPKAFRNFESSADEPLAEVESNVTELRAAQPSSTVITRLSNSLRGTTVRTKVRTLIGGAAATTAVAALGVASFVVYTADSMASETVAVLAKQLGKDHVKEMDGVLFIDIRMSDLRTSAKTRGIAIEEQWLDCIRALRRYARYHRYNWLVRDLHGIELHVHDVPEVVTHPTDLFGTLTHVTDVRLDSKNLPRAWVATAATLPDLEILGIASPRIDPHALVAAISRTTASDLRISRCEKLTLEHFDEIDSALLTRIRFLSLASLRDFTVDTSVREREFASFLKQCPHLEELQLADLARVHLSEAFFNALAEHPSLCSGGRINLIDTRVSGLPTDRCNWELDVQSRAPMLPNL